jgi:hypothetical protein
MHPEGPAKGSTPLMFSMIFLDLREISLLVTKIHVPLHLSSALPKIFSLAPSPYQRVIILLHSKQNPAKTMEGLAFTFRCKVQVFISGQHTLFTS